MANPNFTPGVGGLATSRYDFQNHIDGFDFRHNAIQIDVNPAVVIDGQAYITVADALNAISTFITQTENAGQGFVVVPDGYDTYHNANGNPNFDPTIPSLDTFLNPLFTYLLNYYNNPNATNLAAIPLQYVRIKDGGVILIKSGTYVIESTIIVPPGFILMGEGYGTKIVNQTSPSAPLFSILPDNSFLSGNRVSDLGVTSGIADPLGGLYMFARETVFVNMVIADNFVEPINSGDVTYRNPRNLPVVSNVSAATNANPIQITTSSAHGLFTGNLVTIQGVGGNTAANGTFIATVINNTQFTIVPIRTTGVYGSGGTVYATPTPLISQKEGSSVVLDNVKFVGKVSYSGGLPSTTTGAAIGTDSTIMYATGTYLSITNCNFDGFAIPVNFTASGNINDRFLCGGNKIRAFGSASTNNYGTTFQACPIQMNTCQAKVCNNDFFTDAINNSVYFRLSPFNGNLQTITGPSVVIVAQSTFQSYSISSASNASPIQITTTTTNTLITGDIVSISGVGGNTAANGIFPITVSNPTQFTLNNTSGNGTPVSNSGTVYVGNEKMNISVLGNNITSVGTNALPTSALNLITYQSYSMSNGSSLIASSINSTTAGNTNNVSNNVMGPVAYNVVNTGSDRFYAFSGNEVVLLVANLSDPVGGVPVNLPQASTVPGRIITVKNTSDPSVPLSSPTILVPWGPSWIISEATNTAPIQITTTLPYQFLTGTTITISGALGNTAANGIWLITTIDDQNFTLDFSDGTLSGSYTPDSGTVYTTDYIENARGPFKMNAGFQVVRLISDGNVSWWMI